MFFLVVNNFTLNHEKRLLNWLITGYKVIPITFACN